ncbi:MAG: radical SAM protein [Proteobacteria bacterium]|nr:radical SAM protein [Pseudomonadota bacterium]
MPHIASPLKQFTAPLYVAWEITHRCNARCVHCYSASGPDCVADEDLPLAQALDLIDQLVEAGVLVLAFSGGEPLLHPRWRELVGHAVGRGLSVNVGSNGSCINEANARALKDMGVKSVTISLDSHDAAIHDRFRQLEGLHGRALTAIRRLVEVGVRVVVGFTPTRINWCDGRKVIDLAHRLGADAVNLSEYVPAGRGALTLALSPNELHQVLQEWMQARQEYQGRMEIMWHDCRVGLLVPEAERREYLGCGAGRLVARILPDGTVTPCVFLPTAVGNIVSDGFRNVWDRSVLLRQFRERAGHIGGNCGACDHLHTCGGCRAVAYAYSGGNPLAGDPHCWVTQMAPCDAPGLAHGEALPV